jgi:hypothetical protein
MTRRFLLFLFVIFSYACKNSSKTGDFAGDNPNKIDRIKVWRDSTSFVDLPFKASFGSKTTKTFRIWNEDSIFSGDFSGGEIYIVGLLPDTTNYYGVIYKVVASVADFGLITFDKTGKKISSEELTKYKCVIYSGDVLSCVEYTNIGTDLSLDYYFKSVVAGEGMSTDTVYSCFARKGQISASGKIQLSDEKETDCSK